MHTHTNTHNHTHTHTHNKRATLLSRVAYSARRRLSKQVDTHTKEALKTGSYRRGYAHTHT